MVKVFYGKIFSFIVKKKFRPIRYEIMHWFNLLYLYGKMYSIVKWSCVKNTLKNCSLSSNWKNGIKTLNVSTIRVQLLTIEKVEEGEKKITVLKNFKVHFPKKKKSYCSGFWKNQKQPKISKGYEVVKIRREINLCYWMSFKRG